MKANGIGGSNVIDAGGDTREGTGQAPLSTGGGQVS